MIKILCTLIAALLPLLAWAQSQKQQDFATRFMKLYSNGTSLQCTTISPQMLERMMQLPDIEDDSAEKKIFSQLKSIQMLTNTVPEETNELYNEALQLAQNNTQRYKLRAETDDKMLYIRQRGKVIVEMVLLMKTEQNFRLINLTGNMTDKFLDQVFNI